MYSEQCNLIKAMVERFNQSRRKEGFPIIMCSSDLYGIGCYSCDLTLAAHGCFFYNEMRELCSFVEDNGLLYYVGSTDVSPKLYIQ